MWVILLYNQFVYKLIPWQIYYELHVCKVLSPKISISWYMYMYILCFRQMFSTEQVPATKEWFYAIVFRYVWYGYLICLHNRDLKENTKHRKATNFTNLPYIGNFSRREILVKMTIPRCVKFSLSPIFAISRTLNEDVK